MPSPSPQLPEAISIIPNNMFIALSWFIKFRQVSLTSHYEIQALHNGAPLSPTSRPPTVLDTFSLMTHDPTSQSTGMASSPLHPPSETLSSYKPSLKDFSPSNLPPMSNLTRFQGMIFVGTGAGLAWPAQGSGLPGWLCLPRGRRERTSVSGPLGSRHFPEALNPTSAPQNSPKVSGGTCGVGQINWKCHWDWVQGSLT